MSFQCHPLKINKLVSFTACSNVKQTEGEMHYRRGSALFFLALSSVVATAAMRNAFGDHVYYTERQ